MLSDELLSGRVSISSLTDWIKRWLPLLTWMVAIFVISGQTKEEIPAFGMWDLLIKKASHFLAYGFLALLAWWAVKEWQRPLLWALIITIGYAISDELHQTFVPTRNGTLADVIIDALGGITMLLILWGYNQRLKMKD